MGQYTYGGSIVINATESNNGNCHSLWHSLFWNTSMHGNYVLVYIYTESLNNPEQFPRKPPRFEGTKINSFNYPKDHSLVRAVNKFLSSRLIMNNRRLWNLHQSPKSVRAKASRYILKFRVSEIVFPEVFMAYFPLRTPCCFVRIHTRLVTM